LAPLGPFSLVGGGTGSAEFDGPNSLRASDLNNPNSWPTAFQIFVDKDDGDEGNGLAQFTIAETGISPTTSQILFKHFSAYQMTGVFGSTAPQFAIQKIKSDMGCVAPRTARFAPGFGILRLTHRGVALFDGVNDTLVSEEVRPLFFGSDTYPGIDWSRVEVCEAEVVANPPLYILYCPQVGTETMPSPGLTRCFCYDLVRKAWSILYYANPISTVQAITDPNQLPTMLTGDTVSGKVREIFSVVPAPTDDGTPIFWSALLHPVNGSSPQQPFYFRRCIVKGFDIATAGYIINWDVVFGPNVQPTIRQKAGIIRFPVAVPPNISLAGGFGIDPFGLFGFGSVIVPGVAVAGLGTEADGTADLGIIANNARMLISGVGRITIRGIEWHGVKKPVTRATIYA
jgi:hypothetical protein